jgi:hypothetical protein
MVAIGARKPSARRHGLAILSEFEVKVWSGGATGRAYGRDDLASCDALSRLHIKTFAVGVPSLVAVAVVDNDDISVATAVARVGDDTGAGGLNG